MTGRASETSGRALGIAGGSHSRHQVARGAGLGPTGEGDPVMALSDFLPYGAPELLEGAPARMARSTLGASIGVALLVATLGPLLRPGPIEIPALPEKRVIIDLQPPLDDPPVPDASREPKVQPVLDPFDPGMIPRPVPDEIAPAWDRPMPATPDAPAGELPGGVTGGRTDATGEAGPARDPEPGAYVHVDELPVLVRSREAIYPDLARQAGVEGSVRVLMLVGFTGRVERAIIAPLGSVMLLDAAALEAALTCVFTPALANGHPVKVWVSRTYRFTLH